MTDYRHIAKLKYFLMTKFKSAKKDIQITDQELQDFIIASIHRLAKQFGDSGKLDLTKTNIQKNLKHFEEQGKKNPFLTVFNPELFRYVFEIEAFNYKNISLFVSKESKREVREPIFNHFNRSEISTLRNTKRAVKETKAVKKQNVAAGFSVVDYKGFINKEVIRLTKKSTDRIKLDQFVLLTLRDFYDFCGVDSKQDLTPTRLLNEYNERVKKKKGAIRDLFDETTEKELRGFITSKNLVDFLIELAKNYNVNLNLLDLYDRKEQIGKPVKRTLRRYKNFQTVAYVRDDIQIKTSLYNNTLTNSIYGFKVIQDNIDITKDLELDTVDLRHYARIDYEGDKSIIYTENEREQVLGNLIYEITQKNLISKLDLKTYGYLKRYRKIMTEINHNISIRIDESGKKLKVYFKEIDITNTIQSKKIQFQKENDKGAREFLKYIPVSNLDTQLKLIEEEVKGGLFFPR